MEETKQKTLKKSNSTPYNLNRITINNITIEKVGKLNIVVENINTRKESDELYKSYEAEKEYMEDKRRNSIYAKQYYSNTPEFVTRYNKKDEALFTKSNNCCSHCYK